MSGEINLDEKGFWSDKNGVTDHGPIMDGRRPYDIQGDHGCGDKRMEKDMEGADVEHFFAGSPEDGAGRGRERCVLQSVLCLMHKRAAYP